MSGRTSSARDLYLELVSLGVDLRTGHVPDALSLEEEQISSLLDRLRQNRAELYEVLIGDTPDLTALGEEARSW